MQNILWPQLLQCEDFLPFSDLYHCGLSIFRYWTVFSHLTTKQNTRKTNAKCSHGRSKKGEKTLLQQHKACRRGCPLTVFY